MKQFRMEDSLNIPVKEVTHRAYTMEAYALFINVDDTLLRLNPIIKQYGYEFISVNLAELEKKFSNIFLVSSDYQSNEIIYIENSEMTITSAFYNALLHNSNPIGFRLLIAKEAILLKRTSDFVREVID